MAKRSVVERALALLDRIAAIDPELRAYVAVDRDAVLGEAARLDALAPRARGPLHGVTVGVKDIIDVAGLPTRAGSSFFERLPSSDAPVVQRLRDAGALIVGKTSTHEFAWGVTTENPHLGRTQNPWNRARIVGGSSGGSGAAVAARLADLTLGTDTLGSIRIPSALCGLTGLRPATGALPIDGIVPLAPGLDTPGPMAHDVATVAAAYDVLAGAQPSQTHLRVCRLRGDAWDALEPELAAALDAAAAVARRLPEIAAVGEVAWWDAQLTAATARVQQTAVARENFHAPLFAHSSERYGEDVRARVAAALGAGDGGLAEARAVIARARASWIADLDGWDVALAPIVRGEAPLAPSPASFRDETIPLVAPASAFGLPALALPIGSGAHDMPLGMQAIALDGSAATVLAFGAAFQRATAWHRRRPGE